MNGILNVLKPTGVTSHDVVGMIRRITGVKRVGHTGTLDPMASGVLPVCIGKATRLIEYMTPDRADAKGYHCQMKLGITTDTQDIWGETLSESANFPTEEEIRSTLKSFEGKSEQYPPMYSAVKYQGKKLYEYARKGEVLPADAMKLRKIEVSRIDVTTVDVQQGLVEFDILCSGGTYIRTICHDAGQRLGCGGVMSALVRTKSCDFIMEESTSLEALQDAAVLPLLPIDYGISRFEKLELTLENAEKFAHGLRVPEKDRKGFLRVYAKNSFYGIGRVEKGMLIPCKVIVE
ncbi:MAG: tRNA pseudouridine(55) synthase TruB [Clostridiales Family XIII bacterium]|jgi:tRNA pseudouridine55 synthase|nr:tRNA pseudouridine(55) synthase TruB [Clostridiales Family XIII bacterium]